MTLHTDELGPMTTITTGADTRLTVARWDTPQGRALVAITPEYRDRQGRWHLAHSAVSFAPTDAAEVAAAVLEVATVIEGGPVDPMPTAQEREESRMP